LISRNIDIVAIIFLLLFAVLFTNAKHVVLLTLSGPHEYVRTEPGGWEVRVPTVPAVPAVPALPPLPPIPVHND
jgi:hypothetical protein